MTSNISEWVTGELVKLKRGMVSSKGGSSGGSAWGILSTRLLAALIKKLFSESAIIEGFLVSSPLTKIQSMPPDL
jgi:hypothetical protein